MVKLGNLIEILELVVVKAAHQNANRDMTSLIRDDSKSSIFNPPFDTTPKFNSTFQNPEKGHSTLKSGDEKAKRHKATLPKRNTKRKRCIVR